MLAAAIYLGFRPTLRTVELPAVLEGAIVVVALALGWSLLVLRPLPLDLDLESVVGFSYPALDLLLVGAILSVRLVPARQGTLGLWLVSAGITAGALADGLYANALVGQGYVSGSWMELGWEGEAVLFSIAAVVSALRLDEDRDWARMRDPYHVTRAIVAGASVILGGIVAYATATHAWSAGLAAGCGALVALLLASLWTLVSRARRLRVLIDPATGVFDRRHFDAELVRLTGRGRYLGETFSVVVASPDRALAGADDAESEVARALARAVRDVDAVARLSPERFGVLLPHLDHAAAVAVAEQLRAHIALGMVPVAAYPDGVTLSLGVASWRSDNGSIAVVERAERAMRIARLLGGNQVRTERDPDPDGGASAALELLVAIGDAVDRREGDDGRHSYVIAAVARELALSLGLDQAGVSRAYLAGLLHDLGKVSLPDSVLLKPGPLDVDEWRLVRSHPERGAHLVERFESLGDTAPIVGAHHERWDGGGYPYGLAGERIPQEARIVAVADALVSMVCDRTYRRALTLTSALTEIWRYAGERYDPAVVSALLALGREGRLPLDRPYAPGAAVRVAV